MPQEHITITTPDGTCPASIFTPEGTGPWPGVIFFMDGLGIRPSMWEMGQRLADAGYLVLLPDGYYRNGPYAPKNPIDVFTKPGGMDELMAMVGSLTRERKITDTAAYIATLEGNPNVKGETFGCTGYCMGGHAAITAVGAFPDKFAAAASFHGGGLATPAPDSPHLALKPTAAHVYVAGAVEDPFFSDEQKATLEQALTDAGISHLVETYEGAKHGFAVPDMPVYNQEAAERHWSNLLKIFKETLA
jgi:carboxymethylenebutenolidase